MLNYIKSIKAHHHALFIASIVTFVILAITSVAAFVYPYKVFKAPRVPKHQVVQSCNTSDHVMGECLPHVKGTTNSKGKLLKGAADPIYGLDRSNNNPVYGTSYWAQIRMHNEFAYFKVSEGLYYADPTALPMVNAAKTEGVTTGGYDFLHICYDNPVAEADFFSYHLKADGLVGKNTLPPVGDVEYGSNCNEREWLLSWLSEVKKDTGRTPAIYTGAWYWNPHVGAWWPGSSYLSWISGYVPNHPPMPDGLTFLTIWQFSETYFDGVSHVDGDLWEGSASLYASASNNVVKTVVVKKKTPVTTVTTITATTKMPKPMVLSYKTPIIVSKKRIVILTVKCKNEPCKGTIKMVAEVGKAKKDPVIEKWSYNIKRGATKHPKFVLSKTVNTIVKDHHVKVAVTGTTKASYWLVKSTKK